MYMIWLYMYYFSFISSVNSDHQPSPRSGFFYNFKEKEIVCRKWNLQKEGEYDWKKWESLEPDKEDFW